MTSEFEVYGSTTYINKFHMKIQGLGLELLDSAEHAYKTLAPRLNVFAIYVKYKSLDRSIY